MRMLSTSTIASIVWIQISFIFCLVGNILVLYGTIRHKAVKLDKLSVWIVQNLAVVDICSGVLTLLPILITLYAGEKWVLGDKMCYAGTVYKYSFLVANLVLINGLTINKLQRCWFPFRSLGSKRRDKIIVTMTTIIIGLVPTVTFIYFVNVKKVKYVYFSDDQCFCSSNFKDNVESRYKTAEAVIGFALNVIPCLLLIVTNCLLILLAVLKTSRPINRQNLAVVIFVTIAFLIALLPYFVCYLIYPVWDGVETPGLREATFISAISMFANPIVYFATNETFRNFTMTSIRVRLLDFVPGLPVASSSRVGNLGSDDLGR